MKSNVIQLHPVAPDIDDAIAHADMIQDLRHARRLLARHTSDTSGRAFDRHLIDAQKSIEAAVASLTRSKSQ